VQAPEETQDDCSSEQESEVIIQRSENVAQNRGPSVRVQKNHPLDLVIRNPNQGSQLGGQMM
ncbi:hypothetical protein A2U01_0103826, partial [Trifolium medium]|nr:hypothetical protein [Trifolium medium]